MAGRGSDMKTVVSGNEVSYEMEWEFCPLRTDRGNASTSGSSPKGAASATGKKVTATIATSIPPGVRVSQSQSSGLYGGAYAVPSLTLIETERAAGGSEVKDSKGKTFVVLNCYDLLYVMDKHNPEESAVHTVSFGGICPTCHAGQQVNFTTLPAVAGDHDYAVGLATGELLSFSMRSHLRQQGISLGGPGGSPPKNSKCKITAVQYYNREGAQGTGRCTAIAWSPRSVSSSSASAAASRVLVAAFADGSLHVYAPNGGLESKVGHGGMAADPQRTPATPDVDEEAAVAQEKSSNSVATSTSGGSSFFSSLRRSKTDTGAGSVSVSGSSEGNGSLSTPATPRNGSKGRGSSEDASSHLLVVKWNVCDGVAINSVAFSNDGYQLACVSCDGVLRIFDVGSGTLRAGCRSYFGGYLCVSWSHDGRFVVCGGEDDLVEVFSIADGQLVAFCEGHSSWVSDLAFMSVTERSVKAEDDWDGDGSGGGGHDDEVDEVRTRIYKFISVAQDCQIALWEFEAPDDAEDVDAADVTLRPRHRRWVSTGGTNSTPMKLAFDGAAAGGATAAIAIPSSPGAAQQQQALPARNSLEQDGDGDGGVGCGGGGAGETEAAQMHHRAGSASQSLIAESVPRAQMEMIPSITQQECHAEPLSCVLKVGDGVVTLCYGGILKFWKQS